MLINACVFVLACLLAYHFAEGEHEAVVEAGGVREHHLPVAPVEVQERALHAGKVVVGAERWCKVRREERWGRGMRDNSNYSAGTMEVYLVRVVAKTLL